MVMAYKIKAHQQPNIPAVTHGDGTGRLQTVERDVNPLYWELIKRYEDLTGVPILLNTSFNEHEPIVNTPEQAVDCFLRTQMDALAIGSFFLLKSEVCQPPILQCLPRGSRVGGIYPLNGLPPVRVGCFPDKLCHLRYPHGLRGAKTTL